MITPVVTLQQVQYEHCKQRHWHVTVCSALAQNWRKRPLCRWNFTHQCLPLFGKSCWYPCMLVATWWKTQYPDDTSSIHAMLSLTCHWIRLNASYRSHILALTHMHSSHTLTNLRWVLSIILFTNILFLYSLIFYLLYFSLLSTHYSPHVSCY